MPRTKLEPNEPLPRVFTVSYGWAVSIDVKIKAKTLEEAMEIVEGGDFKEPPKSQWEYVDGSFEINRDWTRELNNQSRHVQITRMR